MNNKQKFLQVAIDVPINQLFDYLPNEEPFSIGQYVTIPFGRRKLIGVICGISLSSNIHPSKLKSVINVDPEIIFDAPMFKLLTFVSEYYHYPIGQTIMSVVPSRLKKNLNQLRQFELIYQATPKLTKAFINQLPTRQLRIRKVAKELLNADLRQTDVMKLVSNWSECINQLEAYGCLKSKKYEPKVNVPTAEIPTLNDEQKSVINAITKKKGYQASLVFGVTGSGKTEVYMQLIEHILKEPKSQALILVPEINLTPQLENRFRTRFPNQKLVSLHSHLNDIERLDNWRKAKSGEASIIIGTRLAIFTPIPFIKIIIIDEEHDMSFKQQDGLRYHARDVAMVRAKNINIPIILGTATPSLESWHNAKRIDNKYNFLKLNYRAVKSASLPEIKTVLVNDKTKNGISRALVDAINDRLERKEQSLIFINRRGFAPTLFCSSCSWTAECKRCSSKLVVHRKVNRLKCHHCGHDQNIINQCPACDSMGLHPLGSGTQKVEEALNKLFPEASILRVDRDTTRSKKSLTSLHDRMNNREVDILVGTQMLAKGHDFPFLTLVGVLDADNALYSPDYRAPEKLFSQLIQVSGRAGRSNIKGQVLIQTAFPNNPLFEGIKKHDYEIFAQTLLQEREQMGLPPFSFTAILRVESKQLKHGEKFINDAANYATSLSNKVVIYDPVRPSIERLKGYERFQLFIQANARKDLKNLLRQWVTYLRKYPLANRVKWSIDVDPVEF
ncbi:primosomal protein N' [Methylophilaceae bacterium]|jgi:primosomal protein N' (replication factor Y) (superfamily II helicase)|nr:primosomal protein N' [Methylophilaceae bacterium]|tara:strand:+ start:60 stop:2249 length:2190 start_codon:yes stop_codon:yes gene_type:complete